MKKYYVTATFEVEAPSLAAAKILMGEIAYHGISRTNDTASMKGNARIKSINACQAPGDQ